MINANQLHNHSQFDSWDIPIQGGEHPMITRIMRISLDKHEDEGNEPGD